MPSVRDVLATSAFCRAVVLAGADGLDETVKSITVAEVPDAGEWLRGGEIVCTTGFFIRDSVEAQQQWIDSLIRHRAVALAVKTTRFLGDIADPVLTLANERRFPLIGLPADSTWPALIESVMTLINDEQVRLLQRAEEIHQQLTELVLNGSTVEDICHILAELVQNPVLVEDGRLQPIACSYPSNTADGPSGERLQTAVAERTHPAFRARLLQSDHYQQLISNRSKEGLTYTLPTCQCSALTMPVLAGHRIYGFLTLIEALNPRTRVDVAALQHGATAISLRMVRDSMALDHRRQEEHLAVQDLIHGRLYTPVLRRLGFTPLDWASPMAAILMEGYWDLKTEHPSLVERPERSLELQLRQRLQKEFGSCLLSFSSLPAIVLVPYKPEQKHVFQQRLKQILSELTHSLEALPGLTRVR
ncbi:MAG: PucR family transcriptional regulator ligand-binding domain-containing protein, partial [Alicyclobacillus sp.]|nr:PucR family transcriptional regulator ligand-binding domain-containing protein [Alicyclobacillus sp.]